LLEESLLKVTLCEKGQQQSCKAFVGLSVCAKMIGGDIPFYVKIWRILTHALPKRWFSICFLSYCLSCKT